MRYYRNLIPKSIKLNYQMYDPHISIVRNEIATDLGLWGRWEGCEMVFRYSGEIRNGYIYYWIDVFSEELNDIRVELGLAKRDLFHITIGNLKDLIQV